MITIEYYTPRTFDQLQSVWLKLQQGGDMTAFQSYAWYTHINRLYLRHANPIPGTAVYAVAYENGEACMIAPLHLLRIPFLEKVHLPAGAYILGKWGYTDYLNYIYERFSPECLETLMADVRERFKIPAFHLHQIHPDTAMQAYLAERYGDRLQLSGACACIRVREDFETYKMSLSKNMRQNIRTAVNRSEKDGLQIRYAVPDVLSAAEAQELLAIYEERQSIKNNGPVSAPQAVLQKVTAARSRILSNRYPFLQQCLESGKGAKAVILYDADKMIGFCLLLEDPRAYRIPVICFRKEYARYSPGIQLIVRFLEDRYADGTVRDFDLLKGTEKYKLDLGAEIFSIGYYSL